MMDSLCKLVGLSILLSVVIFAGCRMPVDRQIETGTWRILADVPVGRFGGAAAVVDGKLHLFGGVNMNPHTPEGQDKAQAVTLHHVYDPVEDTWWEAGPMPDKKGWPAIAVYRDKIYIFGARMLRSDGRADRSTFRYNPRNDTYKRTADAAVLPVSSTTGSISPADSGSGSMMSASVPRRGDFLLRRSS